MTVQHHVWTVFLLTLYLGAGCAAGQGEGRNDVQNATHAGVSVEQAAATITAEEMRARIAFLASDELAGRDTPSPGLEQAARYLAEEFRILGLRPGGDDGSFLQRYPLSLRALDTVGVHFGTVNGQGEDNRMLRYGIDFFAGPAARREGVDMNHGRFVWVGRIGEDGLPSGDYAGRIVMTAIPGTFDRDWRIAAARAKRAAEEAAAAALFVILSPDVTEEAIGRMADAFEQPRRGLASPSEIPVFYVSEPAARDILEREGRSFDELPETVSEPIAFENVRAHFDARAEVLEEANPPNVVAILEGGDPTLGETYVVLSAHMDHVGVGAADASGDSIYNGADDDASGTAALVEVAQALAALPEPPARSLIFLAVSGEEKGLLGSRWFVDHPPVPIERIVADLNIDMISRNAPDSIVVIGQEYSSLGPLVQETAAGSPELGLEVVPDPWPEERFFFRSDHFSFARREIPSLFFFAGTHEDYHRPSDEVEKIDADKAARVARLVFLTALAVAEDTEPPRWSPEGLAEIRALTR